MPERRDPELTELYERAYGPDADIDADPAALERLRARQRELAEPAGAEGDEPRTPEPARGPRRTGVRVAVWTTALVGTAVASSAITAAVLSYDASVLATLPPDRDAAVPAAAAQNFDDPVRHADFLGIETVSGTRDRGASSDACISTSTGEGGWSWMCQPASLGAVQTVEVTPASPPEALERFGVGTTLEFMYRDGQVEVRAYS